MEITRELKVVTDLRQMTPVPSIDDYEPAYDNNYEFSDIELELDQERPRTRSQSRSKDPSVPPAEPKKISRTKKLPKDVKKPRPRRRIHVEEDFDED